MSQGLAHLDRVQRVAGEHAAHHLLPQRLHRCGVRLAGGGGWRCRHRRLDCPRRLVRLGGWPVRRAGRGRGCQAARRGGSARGPLQLTRPGCAGRASVCTHGMGRRRAKRSSEPRGGNEPGVAAKWLKNPNLAHRLHNSIAHCKRHQRYNAWPERAAHRTAAGRSGRPPRPGGGLGAAAAGIAGVASTRGRMGAGGSPCWRAPRPTSAGTLVDPAPNHAPATRRRYPAHK